jgi:hypothetical protein
MDKQQFLREDWKTYKPKFVLCCLDCIANFPQKVYMECLKQQEKRNKTIIITETLAQ